MTTKKRCCPEAQAMKDLARLQQERMQYLGRGANLNGKPTSQQTQANTSAYAIMNGPSLTQGKDRKNRRK